MRYAGDDDEPTHIEFPTFIPAIDKGSFDPAKPLESGRQDNLNYRLYRITGDFGASYDLHDYPFDVQQLLVRFQNTQTRQERVAYVVDTFGLRLTGEEGFAAINNKPYSGLQRWRFEGLRYFLDSFSDESTLGKPAYFETNVRTAYPGFNAAIVMHRNYVVFMIKTLLPLFLLILVVFATLFFPSSLIKERTTIPVTGILTTAVLLVSVNNQLPDIGYTVAIEIIFYVFFGLCLLAMTTAFLQEILRNRKREALAAALVRSAQIFYASTILVMLGFFVWHYGLQ